MRPSATLPADVLLSTVPLGWVVLLPLPAAVAGVCWGRAVARRLGRATRPAGVFGGGVGLAAGALGIVLVNAVRLLGVLGLPAVG